MFILNHSTGQLLHLDKIQDILIDYSGKHKGWYIYGEDSNGTEYQLSNYSTEEIAHADMERLKDYLKANNKLLVL